MEARKRRNAKRSSKFPLTTNGGEMNDEEDEEDEDDGIHRTSSCPVARRSESTG